MDDEILQEFLAESWENLSLLDRELVALEKSPGDAALLGSIFRSIHTIKGTCGFLGLAGLGSVAHAMENVLARMRDGELVVSHQAISQVFEGVDRIKGLLEGLEATGAEPQLDHSQLIGRLDALARSGNPADDDFSADSAEPLPTPQAGISRQSVIDGDPPPSFNTDVEESSIGEKSPSSSVADRSIRVNVDVLDKLMNLVGELVLTRNQMLQMVRDEDESRFAVPIAHLNRVTSDLQEGVMRTRMQPISTTWKKLPRLVRDLATQTGKCIALQTEGAETELDRTVLEAIRDPLTHIIRNSADHGIEPPQKRRAAGKPETGSIRLTACHEAGHVVISIEDDGAGIDTQKVLKSAIAANLVTEAKPANLSEHDLLQLVMHPGLSTADAVSAVSGRGVGMDVLKTQIERINGTVDLSSSPGVGTAVRITVPMTLAIIPALLVESGGHCFAIPQLDVVEIVRIPAEDRRRMERVHNCRVFRLRDRLLPLVHVNEVLGLAEPNGAPSQDVNIVVVQTSDARFGLIVTEVLDTEEIVVKPVGRLLSDVGVYQGTTILGDGRIIMILDTGGISAELGSAVTSEEQSTPAGDGDAESAAKRTSLLLFDGGHGTPMAVPLSLVDRLEEFSRSQIETVGDRRMVQYRGDLLPLIPVDGATTRSDSTQPQPAIVFSDGRCSMGLMVSAIQDIIEEPILLQMRSERSGVLGTAIINGRATDVIDTHYYVTKANPQWFATTDSPQARRILIIDDSMFCRQLVTTALELEGMQAVGVNNAVEADERLERGEAFDAVVCDVDSPMTNGMEFAERQRSRPNANRIPLIALSSLAGGLHDDRVRQAGFDASLTKSNSRELVATIRNLCRHPAQPIGACP